LFRILKIIALMGVFFFLWMAFFGHVLAKLSSPPVGDIDIHILFKGDGSRVKEFYHFLDKNKAGHFAIPGISNKILLYWDKKYERPVFAKLVEAGTSTSSTFEDVLESDRMIRQNGFKTALLVTSDYHMVRSWLLLRLKTLGSGVKIYIAPVPEKSSPGLYAKRVFNESAKFWGSLAEYAYYGATGRLLNDNERMNRYLNKLRELILLESE
jgi:hypothetical protein